MKQTKATETATAKTCECFAGLFKSCKPEWSESKMTVQELIDMLEDIADKNAEVRIAYQRHYPLQVGVATVTDLTAKARADAIGSGGLCDDCGGCTDEGIDGIPSGYELCECDEVDDANKVVWIASGSATSSGYAPEEAWNGNDEEMD